MTATLTAAASGFSNWSHDIGGYFGRRLVERCPRELLLRWVQFGCFTPLMQAHGRFEQEAWRYDDHTLDTYREYVLLHERLVPYIRAAAASRGAHGPADHPPALPRRSAGSPGMDHGQLVPCSGRRCGSRRWWRRERRSARPTCPRASGSSRGRAQRTPAVATSWSQRRSIGSPFWVRKGALVVTYPAEHVAAGLGYEAEADRPLEATLWGSPRGGRAQAKLADGTQVRWRRGSWSVSPSGRDVILTER